MKFSSSEIRTMILAMKLEYENAVRRGDHERVHSCASLIADMEQELYKQIKREERAKKKKRLAFSTKAV